MLRERLRRRSLALRRSVAKRKGVTRDGDRGRRKGESVFGWSGARGPGFSLLASGQAKEADVVIYDRLVSKAVLDRSRAASRRSTVKGPRAWRREGTEELNDLMLREAKSGSTWSG